LLQSQFVKMKRADFIRILNDGTQWAFHIGDTAGIIQSNNVDAKYHIAFGLHPDMIEDAQISTANDIIELLNLPIIDGKSLESQLERIDRMYVVPMN